MRPFFYILSGGYFAHPILKQLEQALKPSKLAQVSERLLEENGIDLWLKRDDLLHTIISATEWRKLKYSLDDALTKEADTLISMGGAYSNHLHALAYVGKILNLKIIGLIRGERQLQC